MAGNDAEGKAPTLEEQAAIFKGFSFKDGEPDNGKPDAAERANLSANHQRHDQNQVQDKGEKEVKGDKGEKEVKGDESAPVELSAEEETDAIQDATDAAGRQLTEKEADDAVAAALEAKAEAEKPAPKAGKKTGKEGRPNSRGDRYENMHNRARTAESRADRAENTARALEERLARLERGEKPALTAGDKEYNNPSNPKPDHTDADKFPYGELDPKYTAALARYETLRAMDERDNKGKDTVQEQKDAEALEAFKQRVLDFADEGAEKYDDFQEVVIDNLANDKTNPGGWPCSEVLGELLLESEHGHAIAFALASDIKEAKRIYKLPPSRQAAWFGVQEAKQESAGSAARGKQDKDEQDGQRQPEGRQRNLPQPRTSQSRESKAPLPLPNQRKLNGHGGNRVPDGATTDFAAFEANVNAQRQRTH